MQAVSKYQPEELIPVPNHQFSAAREIPSKKRVLEAIADLLTQTNGGDSSLTFDALLERERLGSTGLGNGIAIPHCRMSGITETTVAWLTLQQGVDFDAIDGQPAQVVVGLLVPEDAVDAHLQVLSKLAQALSKPENLERLKSAGDDQALRQAIHELGLEHL